MNPWLIGASLLYLGGSYVWRKLHEKETPRERPPAVALPRSDEGAAIPFVCGRYRVRSPILAYDGKQFAVSVPTDSGFVGASLDSAPERYIYLKSLHFVIGIPMSNGEGTSRLHAMWVGTQKMGNSGTVAVDQFTGDGNFESRTLGRFVFDSIYEPDYPYNSAVERDDDSKHLYPFQAEVEWLNGNPDQKVLDDDDTPLTFLGKHMTVTTSLQSEGYRDFSGAIPAAQTPSYRGFLSVFLHHDGSDDGALRQYALLGGESLQAPSFEVSDYQFNHADLGTYAKVLFEANPANVIFTILTHPKMCGLAESQIDIPSFQDVQYVLYSEKHGYSRSFEDGQTAEEMLGDVLQQINGVLWQDRATGKLKLRLIRNDYNPATIPVIDRSNCTSLDMDSIGSEDLPNKVRITFRNRDKDYETDSVTAQDLASVFAGGKTREVVIDYPGCCSANQAQGLADRELADLSRPLMTGTALVSREFYRLAPGDAVMVRWTSPDIASIVFRVTSIDYGTLEQSAIRLGLVQDSGYVYRARTPQPGGFGGFTPPSPPIDVFG